MTEAAFLYRLMTWFSPSYPIGSFNFSHGVEYAVECGLVKDTDSLAAWIEGILCFGSGRMDLILFKLAYGLACIPGSPSSSAIKKLAHLISLSNALKLSPELWNESTKQGDAALKALLKSHPSENIYHLHTHLKSTHKQPVAPIVFGLACADHGVPLTWALTAYLHGFALNLITAGIKLIPLGQTAGQNIAVSLEQIIHQRVICTLKATLNDLGGAAPMVEWTSIQHESQYTRLFQS